MGLHPCTPSAFARSLLDKSPSLLKAHLSTPLIPLGTPITTRKKASRSPNKENVTPSRHRSARRIADSPSPAAETPRPARRADEPTSVRTVRFSPSPRRTRSSPRKKAAAGSPALAGVPTSVPPTSAAPSSPVATSFHHVGLATPNVATRTHHPLASPFPFFSPSTPAIRTHTSYDTDELTDADADGSIWEDEPSMSYPAPQQVDAQVDEVALAVSGLSLGESAHAEPACEGWVVESAVTPELESEELSDSELTETEVATSEDEADTSMSAASLEAACQAGEAAHESEEAAASRSSVAPDTAPPAEDLGAIEERPEPVVAMALLGEAEPAPTLADVVGRNLVDVAQPFNTDELPGSPCAPPPPSPRAERLEQDAARFDAPRCDNESEVECKAALEPVHEPVSPAAADADAASQTAVTEGLVATQTTLAPLLPSAPSLVDAPSAGVDSGVETSADDGAERNATPTSPPAAPTFAAIQPSTPSVAAPSISLNTPSMTRADAHSTPQQATTRSALQPAQPSVSAAPTAKRQLTMLNSLAASRAATATISKPTLTALVPGSAAASSRKIAVPSRLAVRTKRAAAISTIAEASPAPPRALPAPLKSAIAEPAEPKRPPSTSSTSSASTSSTASTSAATGLVRPRLVAKTGLKPPGSSAATSGLTRPTLSSSNRTAPAPVATKRPTVAPVPRPTRTLTVPRPATAATTAPKSHLARSESSASAAASRSTAPSRAIGPALGATASAPSLGTTKPVARSFGLSSTSATARAPRAALAARQPSAASAPPPPPPPIASSPSKRRAARVAEPALEAPGTHLAVRLLDRAPRAGSVAHEPSRQPQPSPASRAPSPPRPVEVAACAETPTLAIPTPATPAPALAPSPFPTRPLSPPPTAALRAPASPLRSPRRVPINSQGAGPAPTLSLGPSALVAPAEKVVAAAPSAVFEPVIRSAAPRAVRAARRTRATEAEILAADVAAAPVPAPLTSARTTRRTAAAAAAPPAPTPAPSAAPVAPIVRSARRPARREPSVEEVPGPPAASEESSTSPTPSETVSASDAAAARHAPSFHPAPSVTQEELNRLTQRNTKRNQQPFNKLKLETVYMDTERPPSPTSKIRRSFGADAPEVVRAATKAGREARAAKRRNALRASADGSELAALAAELQAEKEREAAAELAARQHFRAAGDDEPYETPVRAPPLKSKAAAKAKQRASGASAAEGEGLSDVSKGVRWDRALVYEGPREDEKPAPDVGILKVRLLPSLLSFLPRTRLTRFDADATPTPARRARHVGQLDDGDDELWQGSPRRHPHARLQGRRAVRAAPICLAALSPPCA